MSTQPPAPDATNTHDYWGEHADATSKPSRRRDRAHRTPLRDAKLWAITSIIIAVIIALTIGAVASAHANTHQATACIAAGGSWTTVSHFNDTHICTAANR